MEVKKWWKEAVVYQVYPRSFKDTNNDGIGDIKGIISKLPYIKKLGANVIWICPCYESPWSDNGYDISNYYKISPEVGTNEDLYELIRKADEMGVKILMDLVINHTSDEHKWFREALADPNSKYREYYIFRKGSGGKPPNNWRSYFGGSAWEPVPNEENMFYLHAFTKKMPDLNWENPQMREEIYEMILWWMDKGIGGFRIDAILNIKKNIEIGILEADGEDGLAAIQKWIINQPGIGDFLKELKEKTFATKDIMTIAEAAVPDEQLPEFVGPDGYFNMSFDFRAADMDIPESGEWFLPTEWTVNQLRDILLGVQLQVQQIGWGATYFENHDQNRSVNKYLPPEDINVTSKKMLATILLGFRGTPVIYEGEEIGMENIRLSKIEDYADIQTHNQYNAGIEAGFNHKEVFELVTHRSRENSRTPMQWDDSEYGGFSETTPWFPVNSNYQMINVRNQLANADSVFHYYQKLVNLRQSGEFCEVLQYGQTEPMYTDINNIIAYKRVLEDKEILIIANFQNKCLELSLEQKIQKVLISNYDVSEIGDSKIVLQPYHAIIAGTK